MGIFDGFLICSDLDGTFSGGGDTIEVNSRAVRYFTENGGKFSFVTGRTASYLKEQPFFEIMNAPAGIFNGSIIYDYDKNTVLREARLSYTIEEFMGAIGSWKDEFYSVGIYNEVISSNERACDISEYKAFYDKNVLKIVCVFDSVQKADEFKEFALNNEFFSNTFVSKSWPVGVEFNPADGTKGDVIKFLKSHIDNIHTTIGVGDFENDITFIKYADIGVATGNAIEPLKNIADLVVCDCKENAIKNLIEIIEKTVNKRN